MLDQPISQIIATQAAEHRLDEKLVIAIVETESGGNPNAIRYEPTYRYLYFPKECSDFNDLTCETEKISQMISWGPMQIMGAVARELGFKGNMPELCGEAGIKYGCMHLKRQFERWLTMEDAVSAYNAGAPRKTAGGLYQNQLYVDAIMRRYRELTAVP